MQNQKLKRIVLLLIVLIIGWGLLSVNEVHAAEYYVSPTGNANWSECSNISTPCSAQDSMQNAQAGDIVYFRGGKYELIQVPESEISDPGYHAILEPSHSGTADNPIVFKAYSGETPILNGQVAVKVEGVADEGTDNYHLVDNDVDFNAEGVVNWDIFRTVDKEGGAAVDSVSTHEVIFIDNVHNSNSNLLPGDAYTIGKDLVSPIGVWRQEYIVIDGFTVQADNGSNAARIIISNHSVDFGAKGLVVKNCKINGGSAKIVHGDNREGIRVERTDGAIVSNCEVFNFINIINGHNTSAFKTYDNDNLLFENNETYNSTVGMYIKRRTNGAVIRNNYIHNCYDGLVTTSYISADYSSQRNIFIYNNLITYSESNALSDTVQEASDSNNMRVYNNTFYTGAAKSVSVSFGAGSKYFYNNILVGQPRDYDMGHLRFNSNNPATGGVSCIITECDHNLFDPVNSSQGLFIRTVTYNELNERISNEFWSLPAWQSSGQLEGGINPGEGSLSGSPTFVNVSGNMSEIEDFKLTEESLGKNMGRMSVDMGADVSLIGIQSEPISETCSDSIQNQDETGIDCGGVCEACAVPTTYGLSNFISAITNWLGIGSETSDVNSDGVVNTRDLGVMMSSWGN